MVLYKMRPCAEGNWLNVEANGVVYRVQLKDVTDYNCRLYLENAHVSAELVVQFFKADGKPNY